MSEMSEQGGLAVPEATVGGSYGHGLDALKKYFLEVLLITLVVAVLVSPFYIAREAVNEWDSALDLIIQLFALGFWLLILGPVGWGADKRRAIACCFQRLFQRQASSGWTL